MEERSSWIGLQTEWETTLGTCKLHCYLLPFNIIVFSALYFNIYITQNAMITLWAQFGTSYQQIIWWASSNQLLYWIRWLHFNNRSTYMYNSYNIIIYIFPVDYYGIPITDQYPCSSHKKLKQLILSPIYTSLRPRVLAIEINVWTIYHSNYTDYYYYRL